MKKVIIVTRSNEYGKYKEFQDAIDTREHCKYNENVGLLRFLAARKKWNDEYVKQLENRSNDIIVDTYQAVLGKECEVFGDEDLDNVPFDAIREIMTSINDVEASKPYASLYYPNEQSPEWEVILVLCDCAKIVQKEWVKPEDLFLDSICDDLGLQKSTDNALDDNALFIHADQVGYKKDGLLVDDHNLKLSDEGYRVVKWAKQRKSQFNRIAYFVHDTKPDDIFLRNILEKEFLGETVFDDLFDASNAFFNRVDDI